MAHRLDRFIASGIGLLLLSTPALATFTGFAHNEATIGDFHVVDIYATYTSIDDVLLEIADAHVVFEQGFAAFNHSDFVGGSWSPNFSMNPSQDSFVTIGGEPNFANTTWAGMNWGWQGFNQTSIPEGAGWFDTEDNLQGKAQQVTLYSNIGCVTYSGPATRIMRIVYIPSLVGNHLSITAIASNSQGGDTPTEEVAGVFCKALGALGATECPADLTCDFFVDADDLGTLLANWGAPGVGDVNRDGIVDAADLGVMLGTWGFCAFSATCD